MSDDVPEETFPSRPLPAQPVDEPIDLPLDFEAFYLSHQELYHDYVDGLLGNRAKTEKVVHGVFEQILDNWDELLTEGNLEQQAWAALRQAVVHQLRSEARRPAFIQNGSVARALRAIQEQMEITGTMSVMEASIGLYSAIAELPPRQFDVVYLRHVLGYSTPRIAWFLGLDRRTVDYHGRKGKERLRVQLGLPAAPRSRSNGRAKK